MGLPTMHGSQNMNHIRLINKLIYVQARFKLLQRLTMCMMQQRRRCSMELKHLFWHQKAPNVHKHSLPMKNATTPLTLTQQDLRQAFPIVSNMPFIHQNSSLLLINSSPFALTDSRFGIFHHHQPSISYI